MTTVSETPKSGLLSNGYPRLVGTYDEMFAPLGILRPHWDLLLNLFSGMGQQEIVRRRQAAKQRIRENGVTYNVYGDPLGMDRPWNLDIIPLMISPAEWAQIESGLIQRA